MPERTVLRHAVFLAALFTSAVLAGALAPPSFRGELVETFLALVGPGFDLPGGELFLLILLNNTVGALLVLLFGLLFGVLPVLSVVGNGLLLGVMYRHAAGIAGYGKAALGILPHGIFEIPALLVAASYGMWLGVAFLRRIRRQEQEPLGGKVVHAVRRYFAIAFPLFVIAAAIETATILWFPHTFPF